jgi:predicted esterase
MQEHTLHTGRTARYYTLGAPRGAREVWFVLHGYGQLAARFLERFRPIAGEDRCLVAAEGLSRFYLTENPAERRVGASWMTREDRLHEIDDYVRYLDAVYAAVAPEAATVTVVGFSQGAATACRWAALGSSRIDRVIVWGGEVPPDLDVRRLRPRRLLLVYGDQDQYFTPKIVSATEARLRDAQVGYELVPFAGGHEIAATVLQRLTETRV